MPKNYQSTNIPKQPGYLEDGTELWNEDGEITANINTQNITYRGNLLPYTLDKSNNVDKMNDVTTSDGNYSINVSGITLVEGGTGLSGMTLAAPEDGCRCEIRINSLTSGNVVVTTEPGVTFDGTNNTATFNAIGEALILVKLSGVRWQILENVGSVVLSSV